MSDRMITGAVVTVAAVLTLGQLFWMFNFVSPAAAVGGHAEGAFYASLLAAWFWATLGVLVAGSVVLLMTGDASEHS